MKKLIITTLLTLTIGQCFAAQWVNVADKLSFDKDSFKYDLVKKQAYGWFKQYNPGHWDEINDEKREYSMTYYAVDCSMKTKSVLMLIFYNKAGKMLEQYDRSLRPKYWQYVIPDTEEEYVYKQLCEVEAKAVK